MDNFGSLLALFPVTSTELLSISIMVEGSEPDIQGGIYRLVVVI